jgi:hypothetical protein
MALLGEGIADKERHLHMVASCRALSRFLSQSSIPRTLPDHPRAKPERSFPHQLITSALLTWFLTAPYRMLPKSRSRVWGTSHRMSSASDSSRWRQGNRGSKSCGLTDGKRLRSSLEREQQFVMSISQQ